LFQVNPLYPKEWSILTKKTQEAIYHPVNLLRSGGPLSVFFRETMNWTVFAYYIWFIYNLYLYLFRKQLDHFVPADVLLRGAKIKVKKGPVSYWASSIFYLLNSAYWYMFKYIPGTNQYEKRWCSFKMSREFDIFLWPWWNAVDIGFIFLLQTSHGSAGNLHKVAAEQGQQLSHSKSDTDLLQGSKEEPETNQNSESTKPNVNGQQIESGVRA